MTSKKDRRQISRMRSDGAVLGVYYGCTEQPATGTEPVSSIIRELAVVVQRSYFLADRFADQAQRTGEGRYASAAISTLDAFRHAYAAYYALLPAGDSCDAEQEGQAPQ